MRELEQQKLLERLRSEDTKNNIFISGIPNEITKDDDTLTSDHKEIINYILTFVKPDIEEENYKILKNFEPRDGNDRHSAKIVVLKDGLKKKIFMGCKKFKDLPVDSPIKKVFLKNKDIPMQRKENDRLYAKLRRGS